MRIKSIVALTLCLIALSSCGISKDYEDTLSDVEIHDTNAEAQEVNVEVQETTPEAQEVNIEVNETNVEAQEINAEENIQEPEEEDIVVAMSEPDELLDAFLASEIPAIWDDGESVTIYDELPHDEDDWECYSVGERIDLDNDGENEQIVNGPYGGFYLDARDGKVYVLASGEGTAGVLSYAYYDNATWIVHRDTSHAGRQIFWLTKYDGGENIVDEFMLGAEYWDTTDDKYDENSDFTYRDEKISMSEYEELRKEIMGW